MKLGLVKDMTDSISEDRGLVEEARRMQAGEVPVPPVLDLPYNPKKLAREIYDRLVDKRYDTMGFDKIWAMGMERSPWHTETVRTVMTEEEFRRFMTSWARALNAKCLLEASAGQIERANAERATFFGDLHDRLALPQKTGSWVHYERGTLNVQDVEKMPAPDFGDLHDVVRMGPNGVEVDIGKLLGGVAKKRR